MALLFHYDTCTPPPPPHTHTTDTHYHTHRHYYYTLPQTHITHAHTRMHAHTLVHTHAHTPEVLITFLLCLAESDWQSLSMCLPTTTSGVSPFFTGHGVLHRGHTGTWLSWWKGETTSLKMGTPHLVFIVIIDYFYYISNSCAHTHTHTHACMHTHTHTHSLCLTHTHTHTWKNKNTDLVMNTKN